MSHRGRIEKGTVMLTGLQDSLESARKSGNETVSLRDTQEGYWKIFPPWQIPLLPNRVMTQGLH